MAMPPQAMQTAAGWPMVQPNPIPPPPQEPHRLTAGLPDPEAISTQKAAYHVSLEDQMKQGETLLMQQQKDQLENIRQAAEQQKTQFLEQLESQVKQQEMQLQQQYSKQMTDLQQHCMHQKMLLEKQAAELTQEYNMRKVQEDMLDKEYASQRARYEEHMRGANDMQKNMRNELLRHQPSVWVYSPAVVAPIDMREGPDINAKRTPFEMQPGDTFQVCEEVLGVDGVLYLKLADGRGWLFDKKPGVGTMCVLQKDPGTQAAQGMLGTGLAPVAPGASPMLPTAQPLPGAVAHPAAGLQAPVPPAWMAQGGQPLPGPAAMPPMMQQAETGPPIQPQLQPVVGMQVQQCNTGGQVAQTSAQTAWLYSPEVNALLDIRSTPEVNGPRTHVVMQPGEVFMVSEELEGKDGVLYLKLADGRGWVFDKKPGAGMMCVRHPGISQPAAGAASPPQLASPLPSNRGGIACPQPIMQGMASEGGAYAAYGAASNMTAPQSQTASIHAPVGPVSAPVAAASQWLYSPDDMVELELRTAPDFNSPVTGMRLRPGDVFGVAEETLGEGASFLRLADGRGWAPDSMPGRGILCVRAPMTVSPQVGPARSGSVHLMQQSAPIPVQVATSVPVTVAQSPVPVQVSTPQPMQVTYTNGVAPTTLMEGHSGGTSSPGQRPMIMAAPTQCVGTPVPVSAASAATQCVGAAQVLNASPQYLGAPHSVTTAAAAPTMQLVSS